MGYQIPNNPRFITSLTDHFKYTGRIYEYEIKTNLPDTSNFYRLVGGEPETATGYVYTGNGFTEKIPAFYEGNNNFLDSSIKHFDILQLEPSDLKFFTPNETLAEDYWVEWVYRLDGNLNNTETHMLSTIGILGHNFGSGTGVDGSIEKIEFYGEDTDYRNIDYTNCTTNYSLNWTMGVSDDSIRDVNTFDLNGFSLIDLTDPVLSGGSAGFDTANKLRIRLYLKKNFDYTKSYNSIMLNSVFFGTTATLDIQPSMRLSMGRTSEVTKQKTKAGHTIKKRKSLKIPSWFLPRWTLTTYGLQLVKRNYNTDLFRQGRKTYKMNYAFLEDSDILPKRMFDYGYGYTDYNTANAYEYGIHREDTFFNNFIRLTSNGTLPFIFSPNQENTPANFGVYRLDRSPTVRQSAYGRYDIDLSMTELY